MGSWLGTSDNGEETNDSVVDGKVEVKVSKGSYTVTATFVMESGLEEVYTYTGNVEFINFGVTDGPEEFDGTFTNATASYYGDYYNSKAGNLVLTMTDMDIDEEIEDYVYPGHMIGLDINTIKFASQDAITLTTGTYLIDASQTFNKPMTFNAGSMDGESLIGSYWVDYNSEGGQENIYLITDGSFTVEKTGSTYNINADVILEDGSNRAGEFVGTLKLNDQSLYSQLTSDVTMDNFSQGMMVYRGERYYMNNSVNWVVWLATSGIDLENMGGTGEMMQLEINTPATNTTEIAVGTYNVIAGFESTDLIPYSYIPGFIDPAYGLTGCWYTKDLYAIAPAVEGTVTVAKSGSEYTITFSMKDDYYYTPDPNKISGSYTGPLTFVNGVPDDMSPAAIKTKMIKKDSSFGVKHQAKKSVKHLKVK